MSSVSSNDSALNIVRTTGNTMSWYSQKLMNNAQGQFNISGITYRYVAIV